MNRYMHKIKPVVALATSALLGALVVFGAIAMLGNASHSVTTVAPSRVVVGIGRFNTTDIRVVPSSRPESR